MSKKLTPKTPADFAADYCSLAEILRETPTYVNRGAAHALVAKLLGGHTTRNKHYTPKHLQQRKGLAAYAAGAIPMWEGVLDHYDFIAKSGPWGGKLAGVITSPYQHVDVAEFCVRNELLCIGLPGCWGHAKTRLILPDDAPGILDAATVAEAMTLELPR